MFNRHVVYNISTLLCDIVRTFSLLIRFIWMDNLRMYYYIDKTYKYDNKKSPYY